MSSHQPQQLSNNPAPPFRPDSPQLEEPHPNSKLHCCISSIRSQIAREQLLFGNVKVKRTVVDERVEKLRQNEEHVLAQTHGQQQKSTSPSGEAAEMARMNQNGMEAHDDESYGWPEVGGQWPSGKEKEAKPEQLLQDGHRNANSLSCASDGGEDDGWPGLGYLIGTINRAKP